ncbi:hypothetical protein BgAZ_305240 [Babesia gibsoni]|uniref:BOS complex subunit TMEM147 n=1 Tax=Babesia gibsoni TaxID=33632 RepID=A0AAD8LQG8_BABGI|nr:hypothetical protein BgAZ_305240 [Babesia gibsoni]
MKVLQVPSCISIIMAPYWILYNQTFLRDNFNNIPIAFRAFGYYVLATCVKVFIMVSGVPELIGNYLVGEKLVITIMDTMVLIGLAMVIRRKNYSKANVSSIILNNALGWSLPKNIATSLFEFVRCFNDLDYSNRFLFAAMQTNLHVLSTVVFAGLFFMWHHDKGRRFTYDIMIVIATILGPLMSMINDVEDEEVTNGHFTFFLCQIVMTYFLALVVRRQFNRIDEAPKSA